nr:enoyl-CoA hydratase-related protein [Nitriliruptor alkaliphilus]
MSEPRKVTDLVRADRDDRGVLTLTIDRPEAKNALTHGMRDRLADLLEAASSDLRVRVVVITGAGGAFCAGADLRGQPAAPPRPEGAPDRAVGDVARLVQRGWQRLVTAVLDCERPVVAVVDGVAAGGGVQLALACDLVIASDRARLVQSFVHRGIVPDAGAAYLLTRLVGPQRAKELFLLGEQVGADRALELGLVNRVVSAGELGTHVDELVVTLAAGPTRAYAATKQLVNRALETDRDTALRDEAVAQELIQGTADADEGVTAFIERRAPTFRGW